MAQLRHSYSEGSEGHDDNVQVKPAAIGPLQGLFADQLREDHFSSDFSRQDTQGDSTPESYSLPGPH